MAGTKRTTRNAKKSRISVVRRLQRRTRQKQFSCATRRCWKEGCTKTFSSRRAMFQHDKYMHDRVIFEGRFVTLCIRKFGFKRLKKNRITRERRKIKYIVILNFVYFTIICALHYRKINYNLKINVVFFHFKFAAFT